MSDTLEQLWERRSDDFREAFDADIKGVHGHFPSAEGFALFRGLRDPATGEDLGPLARELFGRDES